MIAEPKLTSPENINLNPLSEMDSYRSKNIPAIVVTILMKYYINSDINKVIKHQNCPISSDGVLPH